MPKEIQEEKLPETKETEEGGIEVTLDEDIPGVQEPAEEKEPEQKPEVKEVVKSDPFKNKVYAQDRIISRQQREIDELRQSMTSQPKVEEPIPELDELDKLAQKDWKKAVELVSERVFQKQQREIYERTKVEESTMELQKNIKVVAEKYPELDDIGSEQSQIYQQVLEKHPRWRNIPDGPYLAMREMEDELRVKGYDIDGRIKKGVETERERLTRVGATSLNTPRKVPSNTIILTKENKEFCDINGISYADYAKFLRSSGDRKVEL